MQRRLLLALLLWIPVHNVTKAAAECVINPSVKCVEYIVNSTKSSKLCLNLSGRWCNTPNTSNIVWYRYHCDGAFSSSCQQTERLDTVGSDYFRLSPVTGLLCFSKLNRTLTGVYCYKEMKNSTCNPIQVVIVEKPTIKATMSNVTVVTGGVAEQNVAILQCDIAKMGCPLATVYWRYVRGQEEEELRNNSHYTIITKHNVTKLIISDVSVNDHGKYECVINDMYYTKHYNDSINLTISRAVPLTINASLCSNQTLPCNYGVDNVDYQWRHNGVDITTNEITANGSLSLSAITSSDFGNYSCQSIPSQYGGSMVTQLELVQQTAVAFTSDYMFLLIHHRNFDSQLANEITSSLQLLICGECCDVTIVMGLLRPCQCNHNTSVYSFKLNGSLANTRRAMMKITAIQTVGNGDFTFTVCVRSCCEVCDNTASYDGSDDDRDSETDLPLTITMATIIVVLLILEAVILISYHWYSRRFRAACDQHRNDPPVTVHSGAERLYDKLNHNHHNMNSPVTHKNYESLP